MSKNITTTSRTTKQTAGIVEKAIIEINKHKKPTEETIKTICLKHNINHNYIKQVAGY